MQEKTIHLTLFDCKECGKKNRQSVKAAIAKAGICRSCRIKFNKVAKGQVSIFEITGADTGFTDTSKFIVRSSVKVS